MEGRILIVDDELSIRNLFEDIFYGSPYSVCSSESADDALTVLKNEDINVIFLDLKLFGMNGIELCRRIRANKPLAIIYAITGWSGLFEVEECREAGFDDYFTKPLTIDRIQQSVDDAFEKISRWTNRRNVP